MILDFKVTVKTCNTVTRVSNKQYQNATVLKCKDLEKTGVCKNDFQTWARKFYLHQVPYFLSKNYLKSCEQLFLMQ